MSIPAELASLDGAVFAADSAGYDAIRRPADVAYQHVSPRLVVRCRSVADVVRVLAYATMTGEHIALRGGGHCFAGRSSSDGIVLDLSGLDKISVADDGVATIGAGVRLGELYAALHVHRRTLPAGCGPTVGITGLTLGGGIGLLGRQHGLTCDRLVGAQVVLADGLVVECDADREPDLFWALRGAGGGQFGVVTSLRFDTVAEPITTRIEARWSGAAVDAVVRAWQSWAPDAQDELTVNLSLVSEPGAPVKANLFGAAVLSEDATRALLRNFGELAGTLTSAVRAGLRYHHLKDTFADPLAPSGRAQRTRSEFFAHSMADGTVASLLAGFGSTATGRRELAFTVMGGAYNRVAEDATAFAHRSARFLLQHIAAEDDSWVDDSWAIAHADGSGRVYPNFPDLALDDWAAAYHGGNYPRLAAVKRAYDPQRLLNFPQAI